MPTLINTHFEEALTHRRGIKNKLHGTVYGSNKYTDGTVITISNPVAFNVTTSVITTYGGSEYTLHNATEEVKQGVQRAVEKGDWEDVQC